MARRGSKVDVVTLVPDRDVIRSSATALEILGSLSQVLRYVEDMGEVWRREQAVDWLSACVKDGPAIST